MKKRNSLVCVLLLCVYVFQDYFGLKWPWLLERQQDDIYKQLSGLIVLLFILQQWQLFWFRMQDNKNATYTIYTRHLTRGIAAPIVLYFHAHTFGYGYLFLLTVVFLSSFVLGSLYPPLFHLRYKWLCNTWLIVHVGLSSFLLVLACQHVFVSYWYE